MEGFRLCVIDGSSIRLPNEADITDHFGLQKGKPNQADCPMGMASVFYDVLNNIVIDSSINPNGTLERLCASNHLEHAGENDLVVYDRGYMGFWLFALHIQQGSAFCIRAKTRQSPIVKDFIATNKKEAVVTFKPNKTSIKTYRKKGLPTVAIKLRLVRVDLPGEVEVLITHLMDSTAYKARLFKSLYHLR